MKYLQIEIDRYRIKQHILPVSIKDMHEKSKTEIIKIKTKQTSYIKRQARQKGLCIQPKGTQDILAAHAKGLKEH